MNIKEIASDSTEKLQNLAGQAADKIKKNTKFVQKSMELKQENAALENELKEKADYISTKAAFLKELLEEADRDLQNKRQDLLNNQIARFKRLYSLSVISEREEWGKQLHNAIEALNLDSLKYGKPIDMATAAVLSKGLAAGTVTAATVFGLVSTYGTAATGAAIGGLHGAASFSSTLALLGGGSLKAGGLGMLGGLGILGGLVAVPAALYAGHAWSKSIHSKNEELKMLKLEAEEKLLKAEKHFAYYKKLQQLIVNQCYVITSVASQLEVQFQIFEESLACRDEKRTEAIRELCSASCLEASRLLVLNVQDNDTELEALTAAIQEIQYNLNICQRNLGAYLLNNSYDNKTTLQKAAYYYDKSQYNNLDETLLQDLLAYGDTRYLCHYYLKQDNLPETMQNLLAAISRYMDNIVVCFEAEEVCRNIRAIGYGFTLYNKYCANNEPKDAYEKSFRQLYADLVAKYQSLVDCSAEANLKLKVIKWCASNDLLQQALTYFTEWIPRYVVDNRLLVLNASYVEDIKKTNTKKTNLADYLFKAYLPSAVAEYQSLARPERRRRLFEYLYETKGLSTNMSRESLAFLAEVFTVYVMLRNNANHANTKALDKKQLHEDISFVTNLLLSTVPVN